jgi:hypothetical protein
VVQKLSAKATDHAFNASVLPRRARCCDHVIDTKRLNPTSNPLTVNAVAVSESILRRRIEGKRFCDLLGRPLCAGMFRYVEVDNSPSLMRQYDEHKTHFEGHRSDDKEVDSSDIFRVLIEKCPPPGEGGLFEWGLDFSTVDFASSMPSFFSSATIRGEPQVELACHIRLMSFRSSGATWGRPGWLP